MRYQRRLLECIDRILRKYKRRRTRGTQGDQRAERPAKSVQPEIASTPALTVGSIDVDTDTQAVPTLEDRMATRLPT
jgi:hypothetical protein